MKQIYTHVLTLLAVGLALQALPGNGAFAAPFNFNVVSGKWARTDGTYTLVVQNVTSDGAVDVEYLNPGKINVSESRIDTHGGLVRLFVKLQDEGYPGCTYTLYYYAEKDALVGFYYQAAVDQTYEVIFLRKEDKHSKSQ